MRVCCLGLLVADVVVKPVEKMPERGKLDLVDKIELHNGGGAVNTGNALAKLGVPTSVIGKVGDDGFGDFLINVLENFGVDTRGVRKDKNVNTSSTIVMVDSTGERSFWHYVGANAELSYEDIDFSILRECSLLHVAYAFLLPKLDGEPMVKLLKWAREQGIATSLDTVWDSTGRWLSVIEPYFEYLDIFLPSLAEAQEISGRREPPEIAQFFLDYGIKIVGIKMGEEGSYFRTRDEEVWMKPFQVPVADTTGAGDAFIAGFLAGYIKGWGLEESARLANAVGACCVRSIGASSGILTWEETMDFIKNTPVRE